MLGWLAGKGLGWAGKSCEHRTSHGGEILWRIHRAQGHQGSRSSHGVPKAQEEAEEALEQVTP